MKIILLNIFLLLILSSFCYSQLVQDFKVNDDSTSYNHGNASMGTDKLGNFVVVWGDSRRGSTTTNIYCQILDSLSHKKGNNFLINSLLDSSSSPDIAIRTDGSFGVCWCEANHIVSNSYRFKFRIFNSFGIPIYSEIIITDTINSFSPKISVGTDSSGKFIMAFNKNNDIYIQLVDKFGNKIGNLIKVNDDTSNNVQRFPNIEVHKNGSFIVCWQDDRPPAPYQEAYNIFMQLYDTNANKIGINNIVNDILYYQDNHFEPQITSDTSGKFCIGFTRWDFMGNVNYARIQFYDKTGNKIGNNINVIGSYNTYLKKLSKRENGDMIVDYALDNGFLTRQFIQRRNSNGNIISTDFQVSNQATNLDNWYFDGKLFKNNIINIFTDYRNGHPDVFCNIRSFLNPDSITNISSNLINEIPKKYLLFQNYPNPFNPNTIIKFQINNKEYGNWIFKNNFVTVNIYNIQGRKVASLVNEYKSVGEFEINFRNNNLSSGIYFYSLIVNNLRVDTKKFIILK